jgi:hypothetical protein
MQFKKHATAGWNLSTKGLRKEWLLLNCLPGRIQSANPHIEITLKGTLSMHHPWLNPRMMEIATSMAELTDFFSFPLH